MTTMLVTGCAGLATNNESLRAILERSGQAQPKLTAYEQGKRHLQLGSAGLAVDAFQAALKDHPDSIPALNGLAVAYDRLGRADVAQRFLDQALALEPNSAVTLNNLAYLNLVGGNTAVALAYAERAKIAAALPMDMMLPDTIADAVDRTAEIAGQLAASESQERAVVQAPALPPESDIKRVGLNEWDLRIRPPNPADAVRINLPLREAAPRVIEPMARPVPQQLAMEPLTDVVVAVSEIPESVMADLLVPPSEAAPGPTVVASLPEATLSQPVLPEPAVAAPASQDLVADPVVPFIPLPEPAAPPLAALALPPLQNEPAAAAAVSISEPMSDPLPLPSEQLPEPVAAQPMVASLPASQPLLDRPAPVAAAIAAPPPFSPFVPPQPMPEPVREEPAVVALLVSEPVPTLPPSAVEAVAAVPLPAPARSEPMVASVPEQLPLMLFPAPREQPSASRSEVIIASAQAPEPVPPQASIRSPEVAQPELPLPVVTSTPRVPEPVMASLAPTPASLAPPAVVTPRAAAPVAPGMKADWKAHVPAGTLVRVSNGTGRRLMASRFARYFGEHGLSVRKIANANSFDYKRTTIFYNPEQRDYAYALADLLPFPVRLVEAKQGRGQVELILGSDLLGFDDTLRSA